MFRRFWTHLIIFSWLNTPAIGHVLRKYGPGKFFEGRDRRACTQGHQRRYLLLKRRRGHVGAARQLYFISNNVAGCSLVRIVEEELIAVGIIDDQETVAPRTVLY